MIEPYENAPATQLVATQCAACGRPLVDAESVETGMGPSCRRKYGRLSSGMDADARRQANKLVHQIAVQQLGIDAAKAAHKLRELGFARLADRVQRRTCHVRVVAEGVMFAVYAPSIPGVSFEEMRQAWRAIPGRQWDPKRRVNLIPRARRFELWELLQRFYQGRIGCGPQGAFTI